MTEVQQRPCPHCGSANAWNGEFCEACGKALPSAAATGPRILTDDALPGSAAGQKLLADQLKKQTRRAANTLLAVAILMYVFGAILIAVLGKDLERAGVNLTLVLVLQFGIATLFIGLYFWALQSPLPASIVGLIIYCTLIAINVVQAVSNLSQQRSGFGGIGIGIIDIIIIVLLAQGISAGVKHKKLMETAPTM